MDAISENGCKQQQQQRQGVDDGNDEVGFSFKPKPIRRYHGWGNNNKSQQVY